MWTADCGLRTADCGLRTADCGLRTADCGLRTVFRSTEPENFENATIKVPFGLDFCSSKELITHGLSSTRACKGIS